MLRESGHVIPGVSLRLGRDRNCARADEMKPGFVLVAFRGCPGQMDDKEGTEKNNDREGEENEAHGNGRVPRSYANMPRSPIRPCPDCGRGMPVVR